MLTLLRISNIVLVDFVELHFHDNFNILSGETGAGKSAIMYALALILGERSDTALIRKGQEKAFVEAVFDIEGNAVVHDLLINGGIDHHNGDELIIRREISVSGKGRAFINNQLAQVSLLKSAGRHLVEIVGQGASHTLTQPESQRTLLDLYGGLHTSVDAFGRSYRKEASLRKKIDDLLNNQSKRLREMETCSMELQEIEEAQLKEGEEEDVFSEYSYLSHAEELRAKLSSLCKVLHGDQRSVVDLLTRERPLFEALLQIDPSLSDVFNTFNSSLLELQEVFYSLQQRLARVEDNPERAIFLNQRLSLYNKLKRKYGGSIAEIDAHAVQAHSRLAQLENSDSLLEEFKEELEAISKESDKLASALTCQRSAAAERFAVAMREQLQALNMSKADFCVDIKQQKRTATGDDSVEFFLMPNLGENRVSVRSCASGGEISRIMLALHCLMAGKAGIPTLVFDEIDSNIGGQTASLVGKKLLEISRRHQILCITHFPQVAQQATHHLQIAKNEVDGRTVTTIAILDANERKRELKRMQGV